MNQCSIANPACANGGYASHNQMYHQRRWSADLSKRGSSPVITVRKNKKEPQPPKRDTSLLLRPNAATNSLKRYSCPPIGVFSSVGDSCSSSSSSSSTCSCSSPPPVQTSVITGQDPLGWKLRPKSSSRSRWAHSNRLSLQIPLPAISPDPKTSPTPYLASDNVPNRSPSPKNKPPLRPKPLCRRHSDSSAFLSSLVTPLPVVTLKELSALRLRPATLSDESDDVFSDGDGKGVRETPSKDGPPPVPEKSLMTKQIAQLIAHSRQKKTVIKTKL